MGVNFVISPPPLIDLRGSYLDFQKNLIASGVEFTNSVYQERTIQVMRNGSSPLQITVGVLSPQIGQLVIVAPHPERPVSLFIKEASAIVEAFNQTWSAQPKQIISCDATIRDLYEATSDHAFIELWESRLSQNLDSLGAFGRPILGGGLRFVMPPLPNESEPTQIEVKIESFLQDPKKIFIETQFAWPQPASPDTPLDPERRLNQVNEYIESEVKRFVMREK
jgi:hypothetical protein